MICCWRGTAGTGVQFHVFIIECALTMPCQHQIINRGLESEESRISNRWMDVGTWWRTVAENVWNEYIKAWLCLLYDTFYLLKVVGYKFNHFWTRQHCMLKVRHWIFILYNLLQIDKGNSRLLVQVTIHFLWKFKISSFETNEVMGPGRKIFHLDVSCKEILWDEYFGQLELSKPWAEITYPLTHLTWRFMIFFISTCVGS